jgi:hypothetical protein
MNREQLLAVVILCLVAIVVVGFLVHRKRHSERLRACFGPEYDRVVRQEGGVRQAEGVLEFRQKRLEKLAIHPLSTEQQAAFELRWNEVQSQFVDDPKGAVTIADRLVTEVMLVRGYPMSDFEQRVADISVDHPVVVDQYRAAHAIALRHDQGQASTEDLRKAMVHYRALFQDLLAGQPIQKEIQRKEA